MPDAEILVDAGPLVAYLNRQERHHAWVVEQFRSLRPPLLTCEPVLTETYHLISRLSDGRRRFFDLLNTDVLRVEFSLLAHREALGKLVKKYADLPMSLADACLVRMSEIHAGSMVFTLDRHFRVYRRHGRQQIPTLMPADG